MRLEILRREPVRTHRPAPLLFVHGAWHSAWCWQVNFLDYFAAHGYECWAPSLRGHGDSEGREGLRWTSIRDYVEDVSSVIQQMPRIPVLIGHSMGGLVVQNHLKEHSSPAAVLLASVPASGVLRASLRIARRRPIPFAKVNLKLSLYPLVATPALAREMFFSPSIRDGELLEYFGRLQEESYRAFLDMLVLDLPNPRRVTTQMLSLGAGQDMIFYPREQHAMARAYGTQATIFPDMAHDMMVEPGWKSVADHILAWLDTLSL